MKHAFKLAYHATRRSFVRRDGWTVVCPGGLAAVIRTLTRAGVAPRTAYKLACAARVAAEKRWAFSTPCGVERIETLPL